VGQPRAALSRTGPLWAILAVQAAVSAYWIATRAVFNDEALYLRAGSDEWSHWLHGTTVPQNFSGFFSGAYYLWSALGGAAYNVAGVTGARTVSLLLMLGVTTLTYLCGLRLSDGRLVASFAAGLAGLTGVLGYVGADATQEPLALLFLMAAVYLIFRAEGNWRLLVAAGAFAALANAAKFATLAWLVPVTGVAVCWAWADWPTALRRTGIFLGTVVAGDGLLLLAGGGSMWHAVRMTTLARQVQPNPVTHVGAILQGVALTTGVILVLALTAIVLSLVLHEPRRRTILLAVMTSGLFITPIDQARLHQLYSLDRNLSFGVPLGALAAACGVAYCIQLAEGRLARPWVWRTAGVLVIAGALVLSLQYPWQGASASAGRRDVRLAALVQQYYQPGTYVADVHGGDNTLRLLLPGISTREWVPETSSRFPALMREHKFSVAVVEYWWAHPDRTAALLALLHRTPGWQVVHSFGGSKVIAQLWVNRLAAHNGTKLFTKLAALVSSYYRRGTYVAALHGDAELVRLTSGVPHKAWVHQQRFQSMLGKRHISVIVLLPSKHGTEAAISSRLAHTSGWVLLTQLGKARNFEVWSYAAAQPVKGLR
jgi:hypothetical protein